MLNIEKVITLTELRYSLHVKHCEGDHADRTQISLLSVTLQVNVTGTDITSERNVQGTDITNWMKLQDVL